MRGTGATGKVIIIIRAAKNAKDSLIVSRTHKSPRQRTRDRNRGERGERGRKRNKKREWRKNWIARRQTTGHL